MRREEMERDPEQVPTRSVEGERRGAPPSGSDPRTDPVSERRVASREDTAAAGDRGEATPDRRGEESQRGTERAQVMPRHELQGYQSRFDRVQSEFIDDPKRALENAQSLVEEAVQRMMDAINQELRQVREEASGNGDTERLRNAMRRYRGLLEELAPPVS